MRKFISIQNWAWCETEIRFVMEIWNTFLHPDLSTARHAALPLRQIQLLGAAVDVHHDHGKFDVLLPILLVIPSCKGSAVPLPPRPG
jgi:hypothetical protein